MANPSGSFRSLLTGRPVVIATIGGLTLLGRLLVVLLDHRHLSTTGFTLP